MKVSERKSNTFIEIFEDYWGSFKEKYPAYNTDHYNSVVSKALSCGDPKEGYIRYHCMYCGKDEKVIGFTCKHAFCLRCGAIKAMDFVEEVKAKMYDGIKYKHLTLTIPEQLRQIFYKNRHSSKLFNRLYSAAWAFINDVFKELTGHSKLKPGCIMVIHVTGRKSNWNMHLHIILTMGGIDGISGKWIEVKNQKPYALMRFRWKKHLLNMIKDFDSSVQMSFLLRKLWRKYNNGFIIHLDRRNVPKGANNLMAYLAKYLFRPSISVKRILSYDKDKMEIEYEYADHETQKIQKEKIDVLTFIGRMVQQVMPKGFKRVRYLGLHGTASVKKCKMLVVSAIRNPERLEMNLQEAMLVKRACNLSFREKIMKWKKRDPLKCKECGRVMELVEVWIKEKGKVFDYFDELRRAPPEIQLIPSRKVKVESEPMVQQRLIA